MVFELSAVTVFVLSLARTSAWVASSPLFGANGIAAVGRLALAIALALVAVPIGLHGPVPPTDLFVFATVMFGQIALGLMMGWITGLALAIFQSAGAILDVTSGFSVSSLLDPATGAQTAVISRVFTLAFMAIFFATNAHLAVVGGFMGTFEASPVTRLPLFDSDSVAMAAVSLSDLMLAGLEIAAPLLGALLLAEVALAITARFVPQANIFMVGMPLKLGIALALLGSTLATFPVYSERVIDHIVSLVVAVGA